MPGRQGSRQLTLPEYGGTLAELIASHLRLLKCPRKKEGVWEDTRMLKSARGDCASRVGLGGANDA